MDKRYRDCTARWDAIFAAETPAVPKDGKTGVAGLDAGLRWICEAGGTVLDFGCGNGSLLFCCANNGTKTHIGIDLSKQAITTARICAGMMLRGTYSFLVGGLEALCDVDSQSADAVILSNILDNLYPDDAEMLLNETARILRPGGRTLIKLNPYISDAQIRAWGVKTIQEDLLDDGFLLLNRTDAAWAACIKKYFEIYCFQTVLFAEQEQTNRLFLAFNGGRQ